VVEGSYFPHGILKRQWLRITGDSYVVDIRPVRSAEQLVQYVTKYVSKPLDSTVYATDDTLQEAILAMHGRRTCLTFASWRGLNLTQDDDDTEWESVGSLSSIIDSARKADPESLHVISTLNLEIDKWPMNKASPDPYAEEPAIV